MKRQLTITAAEWASIRTEGDPATFSATGGRMVRTLWLVARGNEHWLMAPDEPKLISATPPVEFVQACAPCVPLAPWWERLHTGCNYLPGHFEGGSLYCNKCGWGSSCPDCRIELVGPCICPTDVHYLCAKSECPTVTLGHAYAVGEPLPIAWGVCDLSVPFVGVWRPPYPPTVLLLDPDEDGTPIDLAHYGPPESLIGKWAIELRVVGS